MAADTQQLQAPVAFGSHRRRSGINAVQLIEGIAQQLLGQLLGEHVRIQVELLGTVAEGA